MTGRASFKSGEHYGGAGAGTCVADPSFAW
jgi:hypothetical protein